MYPIQFRLLSLAVLIFFFVGSENISGQNIFLQNVDFQQVETIQLPNLDIEKLKREDQSKTFDIRFAAPITTQIDCNKDGFWSENLDGFRTWTYSLRSNEAFGLAFLFDSFYLPQNSQLYIFSADKKQQLAVLTADNNNPKKVFLTEFLRSDNAILCFVQKITQQEKPLLKIANVYHVYKKHHLQLPQNEEFMSERSGENGERGDFGFGTSLACNVNINCPNVDTAAQTIKKGVVRVTMVLQEGIGYCTGTLMNNTAQDAKPYILTAFHCQDGYTPIYPLWKFDFKYEAPTCTNPTIEPNTYLSYLGCERKAGWKNTDFLLLEMDSPISNAVDALYNGWNRQSAAPTGKVISVHHASGDIKKYAESTNGASIYPNPIQWNNTVTTPAAHHLKLVPTLGIYEVGSSGCGLFNTKKQLIGNFNGGDFNACSVTGAYYGRFSLSWEGNGTSATRLKDWLDPTNSGAIELDGKTIQQPILNAIIDDPLLKGKNFVVIFTTEKAQNTFLKDTFLVSKSFSVLIPKDAVSFKIDTYGTDNTAVTSITTADLVLTQKHILAKELFKFDWQKIAADVNNNGTVTTADLVETRKVILQLKTTFDKHQPWFFKVLNSSLPSNVVLGYNSIKFLPPYPFNPTIEWQGIKIGDSNGSSY